MNVFLWNARARNGHVEATLNHPFPAQALVLDPATRAPVPVDTVAPTTANCLDSTLDV